jgi:hypothetical protein
MNAYVPAAPEPEFAAALIALTAWQARFDQTRPPVGAPIARMGQRSGGPGAGHFTLARNPWHCAIVIRRTRGNRCRQVQSPLS